MDQCPCRKMLFYQHDSLCEQTEIRDSAKKQEWRWLLKQLDLKSASQRNFDKLQFLSSRNQFNSSKSATEE